MLLLRLLFLALLLGRPAQLEAAGPSAVQQPSSAPSPARPTAKPSSAPSPEPSRKPTAPSARPSARPTTPTASPSVKPTLQPTALPSPKPTMPTPSPTARPTAPTPDPSAKPSPIPTSKPTTPTMRPSGQPSGTPTGQPSSQPSTSPTEQPTGSPSKKAIRYSEYPTGQPSSAPTSPTGQPTGAPTNEPSLMPVEPSGTTAAPTAPPTPVELPPQIANRSFGYEVDVYWDFNVDGDLSGWGNATSEETQMELTVVNGEMRGSITGRNPNIDSPQLFIGVTDRHYAVIRMMYYGECPGARLLMRSGSSPSGRAHNDHALNDWRYSFDTSFNGVITSPLPGSTIVNATASLAASVKVGDVVTGSGIPASQAVIVVYVRGRIITLSSGTTSAGNLYVKFTRSTSGRPPLRAVSSSPSKDKNHTLDKAVDGNKYSYFQSSSSSGVFITLDLGVSQWVREVKILPSGDSNTPRRCLLQMSATNDQGPFTTVASFAFPDPLTGVYVPGATARMPDATNSFPTVAPFIKTPTKQPTWTPTKTGVPSPSPPTLDPTSTTREPTTKPTLAPTRPTPQPSLRPTTLPTTQPTGRPSSQPTAQPSRQPSGQPTSRPTLNYPRSDPRYNHSDTTFATPRVINELSVSAFDGHARYWRLLVIDNYGGAGVGIREIQFFGYSEEVSVSPFAIDNTAKYKNYYIPLYPYVAGNLLRMRLELVPPNVTVETSPPNRGTRFREGMSVDYIRIAKAPAVWRVRGCLDKYYTTSSRQDTPQYNVTSVEKKINNHLPLRFFIKNSMDLQYADTYDCSPKGGDLITVEGLYFGPKASVYIAGNECVKQSFTTTGAVETIVCITPPGQYGLQTLRVQNGVLPGLFQDVPYFAYRNAPPVQLTPLVTNVGARRVDLVWAPPATNEFDQMMTTGYRVLWFQPKFPARISNLTVGNVTTTSVRGLEPATEYIFAVAPMAEGAYVEKSASRETDLYGRRDPVPGALIGDFSPYTNVTATLKFDFDFGLFNANQTLNHSSVQPAASNGPTGVWGGEGSYGLVLVGSANVQNCNVSSTCCDGYNATIGLASCGVLPSVCAVLPSRVLAYDYVIDGVTRRQVGTNRNYSNGAPPEIAIFTLAELQQNKGAALPTSACGPALRITDSGARQSGAAWYGRKVNVREGFDTTISFEISNPSQICDRMDDVNTFCRSRGADGFAFVIQNVDITALGVAGYGMGYEGIFNSLAVEMDTYHNYDMMDYYENHIAVMTQGWRYNISANHSRALATTNRVPDLTDGRHVVRIKYDPNFDDTAVPHPSFQVNGYTTWFFENADFQYGGMGDWGSGVGLLFVYLDDMYSPILTTPINLDKTLNLDDGKAFIGITAATGDKNWQAHDILGWQFTSLYIDDNYIPPTIVNGEGAYQCVNETVCVNQVDYQHYMRKNNKFDDGRPYLGLSNGPINPRTTVTWSDIN